MRPEGYWESSRMVPALREHKLSGFILVREHPLRVTSGPQPYGQIRSASRSTADIKRGKADITARRYAISNDGHPAMASGHPVG